MGLLRRSVLAAGGLCCGASALPGCDFERLDGRRVDPASLRVRSEPAVITHLTESWPARAKWSTAESFAALYGDVGGYMRDHTHLELRDDDVTVGAYLGVAEGSSPASGVNLSTSAAFFVNDYEDGRLLDRIQADYSVPQIFRDFQALRVFALERRGGGVAFHRHEAAWQALTGGQKAWFLLNPATSEVPQHDPCTFLEDGPPPSAVQCLLQPGEVVYVPPLWWHATCSLEPTVAVGGVGSTAHWPAEVLAARRGEATAAGSHADGPRVPRGGGGVFGGGERPLFAAAAFGHLAAVEALLSRRADPNARRDDGRAPLHEAARRGDLAVLQALHEGGADPALQDFNSSTALHHAGAERGNPDVVKYLVAAGVDANGRRSDGRTPVHVACRGHRNPVPSLRVLLQQAGASPALKDGAGMTPLMHCAATGHGQGVGLLVRFGGREAAAALDRGGLDALDHALAGRGDLGVVERLLAAGLRPDGGRLLAAVRLGEVPVARALAAGGAATSGAVLAAARAGHTAMLRLLVSELGAPPNELDDEDGATPLHAAALATQVQAVRSLLELRADAAATDGDGLTALHYTSTTRGRAREERRLELLQALTGAGGEPLARARSRAGVTALHLAAASGDRPLCAALLAAGADAQALEDGGATPGDTAAAANHTVLAQFLRQQPLHTPDRGAGGAEL